MKTSAAPADSALLFILAIPSRHVVAVFDHLGTLPPEIVSEIKIAGCGLDEPQTEPQTETPSLFEEGTPNG